MGALWAVRLADWACLAAKAQAERGGLWVAEAQGEARALPPPLLFLFFKQLLHFLFFFF